MQHLFLEKMLLLKQYINDDSYRISHVIYNPGTYGHNLWLYNITGSSNLASDWRYGDGSDIIGNTITIHAASTFSRTNEDNVYEIDKLVKFDGEAFEPIQVNGKYYFTQYFNTMTFNQYFVTKKDGTNWQSQDEMNKADIEDLVIYNSLDEIPKKWICIGVYYESKDGYCVLPSSQNSRIIYTYVKIKDSAKIGQTYAFTQTSKYWIEELDRTKYSQTVANGYDSYPSPVCKISDQNYIKTEYDENGNIKSGTHSGGYNYGNSLLILGAKQKIQQTPVDNDDIEKINMIWVKTII